MPEESLLLQLWVQKPDVVKLEVLNQWQNSRVSMVRQLMRLCFQDFPLSRSWDFLFILKVSFKVLRCCSLRESSAGWCHQGVSHWIQQPLLWRLICCFSLAGRMLKVFFLWCSWATGVMNSLVTKEQKHVQEELLEACNRLFSKRKTGLIPCLFLVLFIFFLRGERFIQSDCGADKVSCKIWLGKHN